MTSHRSVAREGAFVMPLLRPGMSVLDAGCGPGSITMGFSQVVAPGIVTGIDADAEQIIRANSLARQLDLSNTSFSVADIYQLPFDDQSFDAVFCHNVFMHIANPEAAMDELFRVCKPGGFIAVRDGLGSFDQLCQVSMNGVERPFSDFMRALSRFHGGIPDIGVHLKRVLYCSGFRDIRPSSYNEIYHEPNDLMMLRSWFQPVLAGTFGERAVATGLMTRGELDNVIAKMQQWPTDPTAISIISWIEYIAWKPRPGTP